MVPSANTSLPLDLLVNSYPSFDSQPQCPALLLILAFIPMLHWWIPSTRCLLDPCLNKEVNSAGWGLGEESLNVLGSVGKRGEKPAPEAGGKQCRDAGIDRFLASV